MMHPISTVCSGHRKHRSRISHSFEHYPCQLKNLRESFIPFSVNRYRKHFISSKQRFIGHFMRRFITTVLYCYSVSPYTCIFAIQPFRCNINRHPFVYTRDSVLLQRILATAILFVCPSHGWISQKTVRARIAKSSPSAAWKTLVSGSVRLLQKFQKVKFATFLRYGDLLVVLSQKRCEIGLRLLSINRKFFRAFDWQ